MPPLKDLTGQRFGRLVVLYRGENSGKHPYWVCRCDCGNEKSVASTKLVSGNTKSCGCYAVDRAKTLNKTHGMTHTRLFRIWLGMKERCYRTTAINFPNYGGRGITICDDWLHDFQVFHDWAMANGYTDDCSIDRIDGAGNYEPANCRWATRKEQNRNRRNSAYLTYGGETHTITEWAEITGIKYNTILHRIKSGWTTEQILKTR